MRIAIPSDDQQTLCGHAGRAKGFVIYDIADSNASEFEYRSHSPRHTGAQQSHHHEHGHHGHGRRNQAHLGLLNKLQDCSLVIASGMGPRLVEDLRTHGIEVRFTRMKSVGDIAAALADGTFTDDAGGSACHHDRKADEVKSDSNHITH